VVRNKNLESLVTIGMRGDGDEPMSEESNIALLERIVDDQRAILSRTHGKPASEVPQLWALYKEVQEYYEKGMRVPDDVTLLWCDDNWGNIRRLPTAEERRRPGGAGVYYHFDYVGGPRNYKWLNTTKLSKVWEQMTLAWQHGADRVWIVNVGDLKPMELPTSFFLDLAWNPAAWPAARLPEYTRLWAQREFGPEHAAAIASVIDRTTRIASRVKPELLTPDTYSLLNHGEADRMVAEWAALRAECETLSARLPACSRDAFFQLVEHPVLANGTVHMMMVTAGRNRLYATHGRRSTNALAADVRRLFAEDQAITERYHTLRGGKWNHMMAQVHLGYTIWQQPPRNAMPAVQELQIPADNTDLGITFEGATVSWPENYGPTTLPALESWVRQPRYVEVFPRGGRPAPFTVVASEPWLRVSQPAGLADTDTRVWLDADWDKVPEGETLVKITVSGDGTWPHTFTLPVRKPAYPKFGDKDAGFVESDGAVAAEAAHFSAAIAGDGRNWELIPGYGRTLSGVRALPLVADSVTPGGDSPRLEYKVRLAKAGTVSVELILSNTLAFLPHRGLRYAVSFDDEAPRLVDLDMKVDGPMWSAAVSEGARRSVTVHTLAEAGEHTLKFWLVDPGVVLQRVHIHTRKFPRPSLLGPEETVVRGQ